MEFDHLSELLETALSLRNQVAPAALELFRSGTGFRLPGASPERYGLAVELRMREGPIRWKSRVLRRRCPGIRFLDSGEADPFWQGWDRELSQALEPNNGRVVVRISAPAGLLQDVHRWLEHALPDHGLSGHPAGSTLLVFREGDGFLRELRSRWEHQPVYTTLFKADALLRRDLDVWGPTTQPLPLMRRIKERFDPGRTLNPGRFWGGI